MMLEVSPAERPAVLAALYNNAFVNGYRSDGSICPDELRTAKMSSTDAEKYLPKGGDNNEACVIDEVNGRWMYLKFEGESLHLLENEGGCPLYDEHFGSDASSIVKKARSEASLLR